MPAVTLDAGQAITGDEFDFDFDTGNGAVSVWDLGTTDPPRILRGKEKRINTIALSADERLIVSGGEDGIVSLWNLQSAKCEKSFLAHDENVEGIAIHPDGQEVLTASRDGTVKVWNLGTAEPVVCYFAGSDIRGCAFTGTRDIIAVERLGVRLRFKLVSR